MSGPKPAGAKRDKYSRLICIGCHDRRIRCELPEDIDVPKPGELRTIQTPCYRCRRLGIPCVIRKTILGRPSPKNRPSTASSWQRADSEPRNVVSPIFIELAPEASEQDDVREERAPISKIVVPLTKRWPENNSQLHQARWHTGTLLVHKPQAPESAFIIHAADTLRYECVEQEWFRHLPAYTGHTPALDLSIKALVAACAYKRGTPRVTPRHCYQALALALHAVKTSMAQSQGKPDDTMLASTALLARFDGEIQKNFYPTDLHVGGLAAILAARPPTYQVSPIARDILDFHVGESAIIACIQGTNSPFEKVDRAYFANDKMGSSESYRAQLKALSNEIFIGLPRLVGLVRSLRLQLSLQDGRFLEARELLGSLLELQDPHAEEKILQDAIAHPSSDTEAASPLEPSLHFASYKDFEALTYYWQSRLSLLRLEWRLHILSAPSSANVETTEQPGLLAGPRLDEMLLLAEKILQCTDYVSSLLLNKHLRMFAHAVVVVWGVIMDLPMIPGYDQDGNASALQADRLFRRANTTRHERTRFTAEDMDLAADIFVGGPSKGRFAERFGLIK